MKKKIKILFFILMFSFMFVTLTSCMAPSGESAYDIAVRNGFKGTEKEWLESLKGEDGLSLSIENLYEAAKNEGYQGTLLEFVKDYFEDVDIEGKSAYDLAVEEGYEGTLEEWLESLKGLSGPQGEPGDSVDLYQTYNKLIELGEVDCSFLEFVQQYLNVDINLSNKESISNAIRSAVSIVALDTTIENLSTNSEGYSGAGVIYKLNKEEGNAYIITNFHVLYNTDKNVVMPHIYVMLYGYENRDFAIKASYVGGSATYDIAVLKVENNGILASSDAQAIKVIDSNDLVVGTTAIAIGNPQGSGISVSEGVVSVDSEHIDMKPTTTKNVTVDEYGMISMRVLRIDTAVNPGNSGGGLFNENGELIGIVNAKIINNNVENIGYAIPSNIAINVADNIIDNCNGTTSTSVIKCLMGVTISPITTKGIYDKESGTVKIVEEIEIQDVTSTSPLYGQLLKGDIMVSLKIRDKLYQVTRNFIPVDACLQARNGDMGEVTIIRDGVTKTFKFTFSQGVIVG